MARRGRPRHPDILTPREWEVLTLLRDGLSNPEIANRPGITRDAAKFHVSQILSRLGVATREEAAAWQPAAAEARGPGRWWLLLGRIGGGTVVAGAVAGLACSHGES